MIGIQEIGVYVPEHRISNYARKEKFNLDDLFIEERLGVTAVAVKPDDMSTADLAVRAFDRLRDKAAFDLDDVGCLVVVTQNPDQNIPHTSAVVHGKLELPHACACFDVSLGCSGYVYGLSIIESFMVRNHLNLGVLITADPYSTIVDPDDRNTALLFGDAAAATLVSTTPKFRSGDFTFGTLGKQHEELICQDGKLHMNGRAIFNFAAGEVPKDIQRLLQINGCSLDSVDQFVFHQGSKYMLQTIAKRMKVDPGKAPFSAHAYGNTVSSSIPILLEPILDDLSINTVVISGFGVGLSWSSGILYRWNGS